MHPCLKIHLLATPCCWPSTGWISGAANISHAVPASRLCRLNQLTFQPATRPPSLTLSFEIRFPAAWTAWTLCGILLQLEVFSHRHSVPPTRLSRLNQLTCWPATRSPSLSVESLFKFLPQPSWIGWRQPGTLQRTFHLKVLNSDFEPLWNLQKASSELTVLE